MKQHGASKIQPIESGEKAREFYTVSQLAELLQLTEMTIYRMISRGELPCYVIGRAKRFRSRDLENFLESCRMPAGRATKSSGEKTSHDAEPSAPSQED
jgi:excisionase family DNA binding protein